MHVWKNVTDTNAMIFYTSGIVAETQTAREVFLDNLLLLIMFRNELYSRYPLVSGIFDSTEKGLFYEFN